MSQGHELHSFAKLCAVPAMTLQHLNKFNSYVLVKITKNNVYTEGVFEGGRKYYLG